VKLLFILILSFNIQRADSTLLYKFHNSIKSDFSDYLFENLTHTADGKTLMGITLAYVVFGDSTEQRIVRPLVLGATINFLTVDLIKYITNRRRPTPPYSRRNSSFPSGHTAAAFFYATYFSYHYPRYQIPLFIWATGIGLSRIYLKRHWPTDVLAGAVIGFSIAKLTLHFRSRIEDFHLF